MKNVNKSFISIILAVTLLFSTTVVSFAAIDDDPAGNSYVKPIGYRK